MDFQEMEKKLLEGLTPQQQSLIQSTKRRLLIVAGAGSGKTEVMARRIALWVGVRGVPKHSIVAFTFTERAAEEMKFRIRKRMQEITPAGSDVTLGGMYVGTIHGFCLKMLREFWPDDYHNFDILDDAARLALIQRGYNYILGLPGLQKALAKGQYATIDTFLTGYDLLNEYNQLNVTLPSGSAPHTISEEQEWCKRARLVTDVGSTDIAKAFGLSTARYYAYLKCRRFMDFSTAQAEFCRKLSSDEQALRKIRERFTHIVVDEVQDINPVQSAIIKTLVGPTGNLTAVGDHRQAIYGWRGGRVDIMADLFEELRASKDGGVEELMDNFRSTPRIIALANSWTQSIGAVKTMSSPDMLHGNERRVDNHSTHQASLSFQTRAEEAEWIANTITSMVIEKDSKGAYHDTRKAERGISYSDIAILLRSATNARTYMTALEVKGIPAIFRAGPDLFSQPEVLLFLACLARIAGVPQFLGDPNNSRSLPNRISNSLGCQPNPEDVIIAACGSLRARGFPLDTDIEDRLLLATTLLNIKITDGSAASDKDLKKIRNQKIVDYVRRAGRVRRVFPQTFFHWVLIEAGVSAWDGTSKITDAAMFHLGQLSSLVKQIETPGWTDASDFKYQIISMFLWGARNARTDEAPMLVPPDAVTISTIHSAKGLEFPVVFLADVNSQRFPSSFATRQTVLPYDGSLLSIISPSTLSDNANHDSERRLMYVGLTRAERYLFISKSGSKTSKFFRELGPLIQGCGGTATAIPASTPQEIKTIKSEKGSELRLVTSFSDIRYFLACPHDFYLRKVLGFVPAIDQAFGYGRGVHNLMRAIHSDPKRWAKLIKDPNKLDKELNSLVEMGLFYLRYTTGEPSENMRKKALEVVQDYIKTYSDELEHLCFEPEKEFETLIPDEQVLVSGAIDIVRLDDPPRVTLIDFKSGEKDSDASTKLDEREMKLQISLYGLAAKKELEYEPERGLVRYLGELDPKAKELLVELSEKTLKDARDTVALTAREIRERKFFEGPRQDPKDKQNKARCIECDFLGFCGMPDAKKHS